jgi:hypothetical protein
VSAMVFLATVLIMANATRPQTQIFEGDPKFSA